MKIYNKSPGFRSQTFAKPNESSVTGMLRAVWNLLSAKFEVLVCRRIRPLTLTSTQAPLTTGQKALWFPRASWSSPCSCVLALYDFCLHEGWDFIDFIYLSIWLSSWQWLWPQWETREVLSRWSGFQSGLGTLKWSAAGFRISPSQTISYLWDLPYWEPEQAALGIELLPSSSALAFPYACSSFWRWQSAQTSGRTVFFNLTGCRDPVHL